MTSDEESTMRFVDVKLRCSYAVFNECTEVGNEGEETVSTVVLAVGPGTPREVDLCKRHREQLIDDLLMPLMQDGRAAEKTPASSGSRRKSSRTAVPPGAPPELADELVCRVRGCERDGRPLKSKTGLAQHVIRSHGYRNLGDYYNAIAQTSTG